LIEKEGSTDPAELYLLGYMAIFLRIIALPRRYYKELRSCLSAGGSITAGLITTEQSPGCWPVMHMDILFRFNYLYEENNGRKVLNHGTIDSCHYV
jgi:hypothetical protein